MEIYTRVYDLCIKQVDGLQAELYDRYTNTIVEYLTKEVLPRLENNLTG